MINEMIDVVLRQLVEADAQELVLQRLVDFANIITDQAVSDIIGRRLQEIF
jgi:hypothetical protein